MALELASFTFNPFQENTYILHDKTKECVIIDPGCFGPEEEQELREFIEGKNLKPTKLILTHAHIDHVMGCRFVKNTWNLPIYMHRDEIPVLESTNKVGQMYGIPVATPPPADEFLAPGDTFTVGEHELTVLFTPGHSPGSISFYYAAQQLLISGDVLFQGSIGRTDLPGGDFATLENSIRTQLYTLPDEVKVYSGHGPHTTIGREKRGNPFVRG